MLLAGDAPVHVLKLMRKRETFMKEQNSSNVMQ